MENRIPRRSLASYTLRLASVWDDLICLQPRFKSLLPENLVRVKASLRALHLKGGAKRTLNYVLFYRIGVILSNERKPITMSELSHALAVPTNTATHMVDWMVKSGYIERLPDPTDRRMVRVELTPGGKELYRTINRFIQQHAEKILAEFTAEERETLLRLLPKLVRALERLVA